MLRTTVRANRTRQNENGGQLQKCGPLEARLSGHLSLSCKWHRQLLAHLPQRAMSDAGGAMLDYDCLLHLVFCFICNNFLSRCHLFSESLEYYNEHKNVSSYCRWTATAGEGDTGDKVKFVINLLPLVDFLG